MYINYTRDVKPVVHVMKDSLGGLNYDKLSLIIWKWREKKCSAIVTPCCTLIWYPSEHVGTIISLRKLVKLQSVERWFCFICFIIRSTSAIIFNRRKSCIELWNYPKRTFHTFAPCLLKNHHIVFNYNIIFRLLTDAAKVIWFASLRHLQHGWWSGSLW